MHSRATKADSAADVALALAAAPVRTSLLRTPPGQNPLFVAFLTPYNTYEEMNVLLRPVLCNRKFLWRIHSQRACGID